MSDYLVIASILLMGIIVSRLIYIYANNQDSPRKKYTKKYTKNYQKSSYSRDYSDNNITWSSGDTWSDNHDSSSHGGDSCDSGGSDGCGD
jgi:hypothetical protein